MPNPDVSPLPVVPQERTGDAPASHTVQKTLESLYEQQIGTRRIAQLLSGDVSNQSVESVVTRSFKAVELLAAAALTILLGVVLWQIPQEPTLRDIVWDTLKAEKAVDAEPVAESLEAPSTPRLTAARAALPSINTETPVRSIESVPSALSVGPENLRLQLLSTEDLQLSWDPLGPEYGYRIYHADTPAMANADLALPMTLRNAFVIWSPGQSLSMRWLAVKGVDAQGRETGFSRSVRVRLPPTQ